MVSQKIIDAFNAQIVNELHASNSYLAIASAMEDWGLRVLGAHFFQQSLEERDHALKLLRYLLDVGVKPQIGAIPQPNNAVASVEEAVASALSQEQEVTRQINAMMAIAHEEKDYATASFLKWFVDEQVEEMASMSELLQLIRLAGSQNLLLVEERLLRTKNEKGTE